MKLKPTAIAVEPNEPFKSDKLGRDSCAKTLTQFISSVDEPLTLSVEAGWGHGKSTFFRMWEQYMLDAGYTCIQFNAWEADFAEDPLIPFVSEIRKAISVVGTQDGGISNKISQISETLRKSGIQIAKRTIPVAAKILTAGLLDTEELIESAAGDAIERAIEQKFEEYEKSKETLTEFKSALSSLVEDLKAQGKPTPLVFMIDELDRCRPTFALSLLERIKHIFNVERIVFVLAIDREQLLESIRTVYGANTDAPRYLRRFIDFEYKLPDPKPESYPVFLMEIHGVREQLARLTRDANSDRPFRDTFVALSQCFGTRLRDQDAAFSILSVFWRAIGVRDEVSPTLLAALLVLKVSKADLYNNLIRRETQAEPLLEFLRKYPVGREFLSTDEGIELEASLYVFLESKSVVENKLNEVREAVERTGSTRYQRRCWEIAGYIYEGNFTKQQIPKIVSGLEVSNQFVN